MSATYRRPFLMVRTSDGWLDTRLGASTDGDPPPDTSRVADTLTATNTGVPSGTTLSDQAGGTFTSAQNGTTITGKRITSRVKLDGVSDLTFLNCKFDFHDWAAVIGEGVNVTFNYCTFDGGADPDLWPGGAEQDMTVIDAGGVTVHRCYITNYDNAFRMRGDCLMSECRVEYPTHIASAHVDGIEMYGRQSGAACANNTVENSWIDARLWVDGVPGNSIPGGGGVTAAVNCTCDFSSTDGIVIEGNNLFGGSYCSYLRPHPSTPSQAPTNIEFVGNHCQGYVADGGAPVTLDTTSTTRILYWEGNVDRGLDGSESTAYPLPGLGADRPRPT